MKFPKFKEKGYQIKENAFVSNIVFAIDLDEISILDDSTELSGDIEEIHYDDEVSHYNVFDSEDNKISSDLSFCELKEFIQELN